MTWFNSSKPYDPEDSGPASITTQTFLQNDGTFETVSKLTFTASRFENQAEFRCLADNIVMRDDNDKTKHDSHILEVWCKYF